MPAEEACGVFQTKRHPCQGLQARSRAGSRLWQNLSDVTTAVDAAELIEKLLEVPAKSKHVFYRLRGDRPP